MDTNRVKNNWPRQTIYTSKKYDDAITFVSSNLLKQHGRDFVPLGTGNLPSCYGADDLFRILDVIEEHNYPTIVFYSNKCCE